MRVGFLHPGKMGSAMAACITPGTSTFWTGDRSPETQRRAEHVGMDVLPLSAMATGDGGNGGNGGDSAPVDVIISICPPSAAIDVARSVARLGFTGIYVDANAIAPRTARTVGEHFDRFVDAGVVGPPPPTTATNDARLPRLYLSGSEASTVAELWSGTSLVPEVIGDAPGQASALKMAYAAWTKGSSALLLNIHALAEAEGVREPLLAEWERSVPDLATRSERSRRGAVPKAWRFAGEMDEIAATFADADLPPGFHEGAADLYRRLTEFKNADPAPNLDDVIKRILPPAE